jgi:hypothetical protein
MHNPWPSCGFTQLRTNARGWLEPGDDYLRLFMQRPELALVAESCAAERRLHESLMATPSRAVAPGEIENLNDADARENYALYLRFRDALLGAGSLEAFYLGQMRAGAVTVPPLFIGLIVQAIVRGLLNGVADPVQWRAAELLFRPQRISNLQGQVLAGDRERLDLLQDSGGFGDLGRLLVQSKVPMQAREMQVMDEDNGAAYWADSEGHNFLLDLTHDKGHLRHGLLALARVLEQWLAHFLGVAVSIRPQDVVEDPAWRWHLGLDVESTALLNDLYEDRGVAPERMQRLLSLFRLSFANPRDMRADVAGKPVYLGLAMTADHLLRVKPQNLLLNLPLAKSM